MVARGSPTDIVTQAKVEGSSPLYLDLLLLIPALLSSIDHHARPYDNVDF